MTGHPERRRIQRVRLFSPLPGTVGAQRMFVLELSRAGLRIAHQEPIGSPGALCTLTFEWDGRRITVDCELTHTELQRAGAASRWATYHSGFLIVGCRSDAADAIRDLLEWHVTRALDEQKANARGIPPIAAQSFQSGGGSDYIRHELTAGGWREVRTMDPRQPSSGFTLTAAHTRADVEMLRAAYESGDAAARVTIQRMAELSITRVEGIPTRRYEP